MCGDYGLESLKSFRRGFVSCFVFLPLSPYISVLVASTPLTSSLASFIFFLLLSSSPHQSLLFSLRSSSRSSSLRFLFLHTVLSAILVRSRSSLYVCAVLLLTSLKKRGIESRSTTLPNLKQRSEQPNPSPDQPPSPTPSLSPQPNPTSTPTSTPP